MKKFTFLFIFAIAASLILSNSASGQVTYRSAANNTSTGTTITIAKPSGLAVGDVMFASIVQGDDAQSQVLSNASLTTPAASAWTLVAGGQIGVNGTSSWWGTVLYRVATASDVAATDFTFTLDADVNSTQGAIVAYFNVNTTGGVGPTGVGTGPFDAAAGTFQTQNSNVVTAPGITTSTNGAGIVMFGMSGDNNDFDAPWEIATAPVTTLTERVDIESGTNPDKAVGIASNNQTTAGATGNGTVDLSSTSLNAGLLIALRPVLPPATATLTPSATQNIAVGGSVNFTATANNYLGSGNYTYTWTAAGATIPGPNPAVIAANSNAKSLSFPSAGTFTVSVSIARSGATTLATNTTTVNVYAAPSAPNLWGISGNNVVDFSVNGGLDFGPGPSVRFAQTVGTSSAALARVQQPHQVGGYFYWLLNSGTNGVVQVFGSDPLGGSQTAIGTLDVNGASNNSLGFVRLGARADGVIFGLAGDGTTLYLFQFKPNGVTLNAALPPADQLTVTDNSVTLVGGVVSTFSNGDIAIAGDGNIVALGNNAGTTQIFTGSPNGNSTTLTKKFDVLDNNGDAFSGSVNGVAFDIQGSLYVSASAGLYYINSTTVNGPAATINIALVWAGSGLTDLASNFFPSTIITPVKMTDFTVVKQGNNAQLSWTTVSEINADHFVIERSADGINFAAMGNVNASGTTTSVNHYQFTDPIAGLTGVLYYRIRTVDIDGKTEVSKIVPLRMTGIVKGFNVYPNPFANDLKIELKADKQADITIRISNAIGQTVISKNTELQKGLNVIVLTSELSTMKAGMYTVEVISQEGKQTQKIIKR